MRLEGARCSTGCISGYGNTDNGWGFGVSAKHSHGSSPNDDSIPRTFHAITIINANMSCSPEEAETSQRKKGCCLPSASTATLSSLSGR